ncbi:MAG: flagellar basal body L-ring protein FlgH [Firmicutes bacterium]|nr:flagellar basal body L-ring protein FlgH [Bacillota bacterium]
MRHYMRSIIIGMTLTIILLIQGNALLADSLWTDQSVSLYGSKPRFFQAGDILTVLIVEQAQATQRAESSSDERNSVNAGPGTGLLSKIFPENIGADWGASSQGKGSTTRGGSLQAKISVEVVGVNPNGVLVIEGQQIIKVNNEEQVLKISGMVRAEDVSNENVVLSSNIANAVIEYQGNGNINNAQKPGILTRFFHWIF